jgi:hypothetical protein
VPIVFVIMDFVAKKSGQLNVSISDEIAETLETIHKNHGISSPELVRQLLAAVRAFYEKYEFFSLPVHIEPEATFLARAKQYKSDAAPEAKPKRKSA